MKHHRRRFALLTLLCQLVLVGVAPVVDARLEAQSLRAGSTLHVEDADTTTCTPSHDHGSCVICRALHDFDGNPESGAPPPITDIFSDPSPSRVDLDHRIEASIRSHGPRAPPFV